MKHLKVFSLFIVGLLLGGQALAQTIEIDAGYWTSEQDTKIVGMDLPLSSQESAECVSKEAAKQPLQAYVARFRDGLDSEDEQCDLSNIKHLGKTVTADVSCHNADGLTSQGTVQYNYSRKRVETSYAGTIESPIGAVEVTANGLSVWRRECTDEEASTAQTDEGDNQAASRDARLVISPPQEDAVQASEESDDYLDEIIKLSPNSFIKQIQALNTDKPIFVHFTSTDANCGHCRINNAAYIRAHKKWRGKYVFAEIDFNPWPSFERYAKFVKGVPATVLYKNKAVAGMLVGRRADLPNVLDSMHHYYDGILSDSYDDVDITPLTPDTVTGDSFKPYIERDRGDRFLFIHLTSDDDVCPHCVNNNAFFRHTVRNLPTQFDYAEITFNPFSKLESSTEFRAYLKSHNINLDGLPAVLTVHKGKPRAVRSGVWTTMKEDLEAASKR